MVAGEDPNDCKVLQHLIPALYPGSCPEVKFMRKPVRLARAQATLSPRLQEIRRFAQGLADKARLAGVVIHVDFDAVADEKYDSVRRRITEEMRGAFKECCPSALALSAYEMEAWLMLFPEAFPKVKPGWQLKEAERRRDLGQIMKAKEHLTKSLGKPPYSESHAPKIMEEAVKGGHVTARPTGNNRSFRDFADELADWKKAG
ncbi:hypothetical protein [Streptomyces europaeiscabiei]|uniref:hypothetical protein n=1 Tax=Streptomyces europaeiscabiei TaxID=146819 RepID=UPI000765AC58|nr:hypothetical protein [Streptomyces europaeiscabiei]MDX2524093.1 hypothetical protein [Streptomyces europaeiscabiei]MDX3666358.1 hypothetical protein [Streptomyces europaeiscabiei]MDX3864811.1 hypothetical protein [Streptomyces europaeiscabiei]MDX3871009.1 hypothetical protein [Streptomyces europaeiscabiei]